MTTLPMFNFATSIFTVVLSFATRLTVAQGVNIYLTAVDEGIFETLVTAVDRTDLDDMLSDDGPFTLLAPTDEAFEALPGEFVECLLFGFGTYDIRLQFLNYHLLNGMVNQANLRSGSVVTLISESISLSNDGLNGGQAQIEFGDIETSNGLIHILNGVLFPPGVDVDTVLNVCNTNIDPIFDHTGEEESTPIEDIPTTLANRRFETLVQAMQTANLISEFTAPEGPYTVFAPNEFAFRDLPQDLVPCLLDPVKERTLQDILNYHIVSGNLTNSDLRSRNVFWTLKGENITIEAFDDVDDQIIINGYSAVDTRDIAASNGMIHSIDTVLIPPSINYTALLDDCFALVEPDLTEDEELDLVATALETSALDTFLDALYLSELDETLESPNGPYTVFAPVDSAFESLPPTLLPCLLRGENRETLVDVLLYHVVNGVVLNSDLGDGSTQVTLNPGQSIAISIDDGNVTINDVAEVVSADIAAGNGVLHLIDTVLIPRSMDLDAFLASCPETAEPTMNPTETSEPTFSPEPQDIPAMASSEGFSTLVAALEAADLLNDLRTPNGPFTVFAPSDSAFANLPNGLLSCLLRPESTSVLEDIMTYHVTNRALRTLNLVPGLIEMLNNATLTVNVTEEGVIILDETVEVVTEDIIAGNGIMHAIDSVLLPPDLDLVAFMADCLNFQGSNGGGDSGGNDDLGALITNRGSSDANEARASLLIFALSCVVSMLS